MPTAATLSRCIERTRRAQDGRGAAQAERLCAAELGGGSINANAAAAARRIGEFLRLVKG